MHKAIRILRDEHRSIAAVLHALSQLTHAALNPGRRPDFERFRLIIHYMEDFPERVHHPKEETHLFGRVAAYVPHARRLIEDLRAEHLKSAQLVMDLKQALAAFEENWPRGASSFVSDVNRFAEFQWKHMRTEEHELLPAAKHHLPAADWRAVAAAFAANTDPLSGLDPEGAFEKLFERIVASAPALMALRKQQSRTFSS